LPRIRDPTDGRGPEHQGRLDQNGLSQYNERRKSVERGGSDGS
jgi:hypothetical protein